MHQTVAIQISKAVNLFPNYSLEEWIFFFPCQVIINAVHMIISHEILEMIKIVKKHERPEESIDDGSDSSMRASAHPNENERLRPKTSPENSQDYQNRRLEEEEIEEEDEEKLILKKINTGGTEMEQGEIEEMFGKFLDKNFLGKNKADTINMLQQKSFRGLYLRLQFWVNQLDSLLYGKKQGKKRPKYTPLQQTNVQNIMMFIIYMRDMVHDIYESSSGTVRDYEWNKHLRLVFDQQSNHCLIECGGWTGFQGNEYLGSQQRFFITPISEKYFVFISSALREKSGVAFRAIPRDNFCSHIVQELANVCTVPLRSFFVTNNSSPSYLLQCINGSAFSNTWLCLEHINNLKLEVFRIVCKEVLIMQQKYILSEINNDPHVMRAIVLKPREKN